MSKFFALLLRRPSESWLGLWATVVLILSGLGIMLDPRIVAGVGALINWLITGYASQPDNPLGPK